MQYAAKHVPPNYELTKTETIPVYTPITVVTAVTTRGPDNRTLRHVNEYPVIGLVVETYLPPIVMTMPEIVQAPKPVIRYDYVVVHDGEPLPLKQIPHQEGRVTIIVVLQIYKSKDEAFSLIKAAKAQASHEADIYLLQVEAAGNTAVADSPASPPTA